MRGNSLIDPFGYAEDLYRRFAKSPNALTALEATGLPATLAGNVAGNAATQMGAPPSVAAGIDALTQTGILPVAIAKGAPKVGKEIARQYETGQGLIGRMAINPRQYAVESIDDFAYRGSHKAPGPDFGAPLYDLTGGGQMYPADVYSNKAVQYYGTGFPKADKEAFALAQSVKGNPDAVVTMYRAVPKDESIKSINAGDWVTLSKEYAKTHGESVLNNQYKIIAEKVKAKDLWTNADSIHEFGYWPSK